MRRATDPRLVEKVKFVQRSSQEWKGVWRKFCNAEGNGVCDPSRHDNDFLQRFLHEHGLDSVVAGGEMAAPFREDRGGAIGSRSGAMGGLGGVGGVCGGMGSGIGMSGMGMGEARQFNLAGRGFGRGPPVSSTLEPLVQRVKFAQKSSEDLKKAWHHMCDTEGGGIRDPARHDAAFLMRFLEGVLEGVS